MSVSVLPDQLLGRQVPSQVRMPGEGVTGSAGCRQRWAIFICSGLIKLVKGESV